VSRAHRAVDRALGSAAKLAAAAIGLATGCAAEPCGPAQAEVQRVLDGDTVELVGGQLVRYLLIDTPELADHECFAVNAAQLNADLVQGQAIELRYDRECRDDYGRLLAYVSVAGREVNRLLVERGYACVLSIAPNGADRLDAMLALQADARAHRRGLWGACTSRPCR
jgi:micrococcal nuclease